MKPPKISAAEAQVMEALWAASPLTAEQVTALVGPGQDWTEGTVRTLLRRLTAKGAIKAAPDGRRHLYSPLMQRDAWLAAESRGFLDRLFDGRLALMVTQFTKDEKLSPEDLAELKRLIAKVEDDR
ncbi:MAG: BlaI/MecI/CopY family transcriptional regulator [Caulobacteraceae bacterium]|nr:BlaI/MecI/CopY family transcriptional regulator [Caulobacteraceae bacterium]